MSDKDKEKKYIKNIIIIIVLFLILLLAMYWFNFKRISIICNILEVCSSILLLSLLIVIINARIELKKSKIIRIIFNVYIILFVLINIYFLVSLIILLKQCG